MSLWRRDWRSASLTTECGRSNAALGLFQFWTGVELYLGHQVSDGPPVNTHPSRAPVAVPAEKPGKRTKASASAAAPKPDATPKGKDK